MESRDDVSGGDGRGRHWPSVWKVLVVVAVIAALYNIPRQGYEGYDRKAAVAEILKRAEPLQDRYLASTEAPAVSEAGSSALTGRYRSPVDKGDTGTLSFNWSMRLEDSKVRIEIGPGFDGERRYSIILAPVTADGKTEWDCTGGTLPQRYRTQGCRGL